MSFDPIGILIDESFDLAKPFCMNDSKPLKHVDSDSKIVFLRAFVWIKNYKSLKFYSMEVARKS